MPFTPAAEAPGLLHHKLTKNASTTEATPDKWTVNQDYQSRVTVTGARQLFHNCWFRRGVDPMRAAGCAFVHCKFGDEHLGVLDPANPQYSQLLSQLRSVEGTEVSDGAQWGPQAKFLWCETSGEVIDGYKIGMGEVIEDSYIHDLFRVRTDFYTARGDAGDLYTHNDAVQCLQATTPVAVRRTKIVQRQQHMSAFMIQPISADIVEFIIEGNFLEARQCIFAISKGNKGVFRKLTVRNNVFGDGVEWALVGRYLDRNITQVVWEGNTWANGKALTLDNALKNPSPR
jgi:hypothetical protein